MPDLERPNGVTAQIHKGTVDWALSVVPYVEPASPDDLLARKAVAKIEREDGFEACARHRIHGAYDDDHEHRIALAAIRLARESGSAS